MSLLRVRLLGPFQISPDGLTWMEVHGPDSSITGCRRVMRMTADHVVGEIGGGFGKCLKYIVSKSNHDAHRFQWSTFYATNGKQTIRLGVGRLNTAVACGKHVYWLSHPYDVGDHDSGKHPPRGREILRWNGGPKAVESVYTEQMPDDPAVYAGYVFKPLCTDGVLTAGAKYFTPEQARVGEDLLPRTSVDLGRAGRGRVPRWPTSAHPDAAPAAKARSGTCWICDERWGI